MQPYPVHEALNGESYAFIFNKHELLQYDQVNGGWKCELEARGYGWEGRCGWMRFTCSLRDCNIAPLDLIPYLK